MSELPINIDGHHLNAPRCFELLEMYDVRRPVERVAVADAEICRESMVVNPTGIIRDLRELIVALDRRTPQIARAGEAAIARDAASLKARALKRIEALEREAGAIKSL